METGICQASQILSRSGIITSAGTLLSANENRRGVIIQNLNSTNPLFVKFGTGASSTDFDFILKSGSSADDGNGGLFQSSQLVYQGLITVAGTTVRCTATEI